MVQEHHGSWGCEFNDSYGKNLLKAINHCDLVYLNHGTPTLVNDLGFRRSAIDLTLCSPDIFHLLSWLVLDDPYGSNHLLIIMESIFSIQNISIIRSHKIWRTNKANWNFYNNCMESTTSYNYKQLVSNINIAAEKTIPKNSPTVNKNRSHVSKPW